MANVSRTSSSARRRSLRRRLAERLDPGRSRPVVIRPHLRALGGVKVQPATGGLLASFYPLIEAPARPEEEWRAHALDTTTLAQVSSDRLMAYLADLSPEVSKALWDFLRMINPGFEIEVLTRAGGRRYAKGQAALQPFLELLANYHGTLDVLFNKLFLGAWLRGAFLSELVLDEAGRTAIDLAAPDPAVVRFKRVEDEQRGQIWQLGQYQNGKWVSLEDPTVRHAPIDPLPGAAPYGRALVAPALFAAVFLLSLLHDLRRVVAQQGYPRLDLEIDLERLMAAMPAETEGDPERLAAWVQKAIDDITAMYASLEPDDAYVHTDVVQVKSPVGAINSNGLGALEGLIRGVERMTIRALKTMPILMGSNEAVAETHARWQWEIQAVGIRSLQHVCENMLSYQFGLALRAGGISAYVRVRFAEVNELTRRSRAETEEIEIRNAARKRNEGWITQDEAAEEITGHKAAAEAPAALPGLRGAEVGGRRPESRGRRDTLEVDGAGETLPALPEEIVYDEEDIDRIAALWDEVMADEGVAGLLEAEVEAEETARGRGRRASDGPGWVWEPRARRYREKASGRFIDQTRLRELRNLWTDRMLARSDRLVERLAAKEIDLPTWVGEMRNLIKDTYGAQYMAARGGRHAMTQSDWGRVGRMVRDQYGYLQGFARDLAGGRLSEGQAMVRARLYIESSTQAFEQGKRESFGLPAGALPQMPGDGQTECLTNCRCYWHIRELADRWECTWTLDPEAEHCGDCETNAAAWAPLVIYKEGV